MSFQSKVTRRLAVLSGTAFLPFLGVLGGDAGGCFRNDAFAGLFANAGNAAIASVFDGAIFNDQVANSDYDQFVRQPLSEVTQDAWTEYVFGRYAADPEFPSLLEQ